VADCEFTGLAPQFVVPDVRAAAEFYRDKFGFEILGYFFAEPPVYAIVRRGAAEIHFGRSDVGAGIQTNENVRKGLGIDAYVFVSNIDVLHRELIRRNAEILEGPVKRIYGRTEITVRDLNGFRLVFGE
jgi:catechol 2,3-dioxygenase-like lactoylglutathione lyase family enzyme